MTATILIIDDDKFTRQVLRRILERDPRIARFKPKILVASDGLEGVEIFERERPALVIVDLFMPKLDGFAVCKRLRELASPDVLAIAVTSGVYKEASISTQIETDYAVTFFAKPYQLKSIAGFALQALKPRAGLSPVETEASESAGHASSGKLEQRGAAAVFWDLLEQEATGRLILRREQVVRQIEFFVGHPLSVTTNVREETLGQFLVARNVIDVAILRKAMASAASKKLRLGETLIEMGTLSPQQLLKQLTAQTRLKLVRALRWDKGSWRFNAAAPSNRTGNALDFAEVIVTGLASTARVDPPSPEVRSLRSQALVLNERGHNILAQLGTSVSSAFAKNFREGIGGDELGRLGVNRLELYTCLDILHVCGGLLSHEPTGVPLAASDHQSEPMSLTLLADSSDKQSSRDALYASLFDSDAGTSPAEGAGPLSRLASKDLWAPEGDAAIEISADAASNDHPPGPEEFVEPPQAEKLQGGEESVVSVSFSAIPKQRASVSAQEQLISEFLRIQQKTIYEILEVARDAALPTIEASYHAHSAAFAKERFQSAKLGRDYQKLDVLHEAYEHAWNTLNNETKRAQYDELLAHAAADMPGAPSLDAELVFREAEEFLAAGNISAAISKLKSSIVMAPHESAYRASLGWALFVQGDYSATAADAARPHLNQALTLSPDSGLVHEYKGRIHAALADDLDAAILHLGKALDDDPRRGEALLALEKLHLERGEVRELEAIYRRLIFRLVDNHGGEEAVIWSRLGDLHAHYMHDEASALVAYERALRLSPTNGSLQAKCAQRRSGGQASFYAEASALIAGWQQQPRSLVALQTLLAKSQAAKLNDSAFLNASALVALGAPEPKVHDLYQRYRPRFVIRAQQAIEGKRWTEILHEQDHARVGELYALLAPIIQTVSPSPGAKEELAKADPLKESALPPDFLAVRNYVAQALAMPVPEVRARSDYHRVISVADVETPVLLAGYDTLTCTSKLELCFRLGRAMSYLRPGRATAAASPARALRSAMLACYSLAAPHAQIPDADGQIELFRDALAEGDSVVRAQLEALVVHISREHPTLNLSHWARILSRTADRVGLVLCGDIPLAKRIASELSGAEAAIELVAYSLSPRHLQLRQELGLAIEV